MCLALPAQPTARITLLETVSNGHYSDVVAPAVRCYVALGIIATTRPTAASTITQPGCRLAHSRHPESHLAYRQVWSALGAMGTSDVPQTLLVAADEIIERIDGDKRVLVA
jgi:hypothetical protein